MGMLTYAPTPTPMAHSFKPDVDTTNKLSDTNSSLFRRLICHLIYLINTRLSITYVVHLLSQFVSSPTTSHQ